MPWIQYTITDGLRQAVVSDKLTDSVYDTLLAQGRDQILVPDGLDGNAYNVNITQNPPKLVLAG